VSFDVWADRAEIPEGPVRAGLKRMYAEYNQYGFHGGNATVLKCLLGHDPRSLKQYLHELAARNLKAA
jgi:hypothetical protein